MITLTAFRWVPHFVQGYAKDLRIRWALEEAQLPYEAVLIDRAVQQSESYRAWQPFGQVPAYRDEEVELFESGAIVLHIAAKCEALAPTDIAGRARVTAWVIAALNSVEPHAQNFLQLDDGLADIPEVAGRRAAVAAKLRDRLSALVHWLGDKAYLEGSFTAGDLIMTTVLRELAGENALAEFPALDAYRARCEARPAFQRAYRAHMDAFEKQ